jgi:hypothetical protein
LTLRTCYRALGQLFETFSPLFLTPSCRSHPLGEGSWCPAVFEIVEILVEFAIFQGFRVARFFCCRPLLFYPFQQL